MKTIKMHYDGWIALPLSMRRKLGLETGVVIEAQLTDDGVLLRPAQSQSGAADREPIERLPVEIDEDQEQPAASEPSKRGRKPAAKSAVDACAAAAPERAKRRSTGPRKPALVASGKGRIPLPEHLQARGRRKVG